MAASTQAWQVLGPSAINNRFEALREGFGELYITGRVKDLVIIDGRNLLDLSGAQMRALMRPRSSSSRCSVMRVSSRRTREFRSPT